MTAEKAEVDSLVTAGIEAAEAVETSSASCELGSWEGARFWKMNYVSHYWEPSFPIMWIYENDIP